MKLDEITTLLLAQIAETSGATGVSASAEVFASGYFTHLGRGMDFATDDWAKAFSDLLKRARGRAAKNLPLGAGGEITDETLRAFQENIDAINARIASFAGCVAC